MKDKKLPALQFYPGDWRKSVDVQSLNFHDRGVWFEMLMLMHESERRGVLVLNGHPMNDEMIARVLGLDKQTFNQTLTTLLTIGVASREEVTGAIMCRRMVRDENLRKVRSEAGSKGGNPVLVKQNKTIRDKQKSTPSSSSSSSPSDIPPEMVARGISDLCGLQWPEVFRILMDSCKREMGLGVAAEIVRDTMSASWQKFQASKPKLEYAWGAEKFFGEGYWKNERTWPWKEGHQPEPPKPTRIYINGKQEYPA